MKKITLLFAIITLSTSWQLNAQCWQDFNVGSSSTMAIKLDGTLWGWGLNVNGMLGNGTQTGSPIPIQIGTATNWLKISCGSSRTLAIKTDGTLWAWGGGFTTPKQIGTDTDWKIISAGFSHVAALKNNGTIWVWGTGGNGQIGNNQTLDQLLPTQVGTETDWIAITTGLSTTIALKSDGTLWAWGRNDLGQLGTNTGSSNKLVPTKVGTANNWKSISTEGSQSAAIKTDGTLWNWGRATGGDSSFVRNLTIPTQVGTDTDWQQVTCGSEHYLAIKTDGSLWAKGSNTRGQLGDNTLEHRFLPVQIGTDTNWTSTSSGSNTSSGIKSDGTFYYWGENGTGSIYGNNSNVQSEIPLLIACPTNLSTDVFSNFNFSIFPNPSSGVFNIQTSASIENVSITISNLNGKIVHQSKAENLTNKQLNLNHLQNGIYILNISNGNFNYAQKLVKQ